MEDFFSGCRVIEIKQTGIQINVFEGSMPSRLTEPLSGFFFKVCWKVNILNFIFFYVYMTKEKNTGILIRAIISSKIDKILKFCENTQLWGLYLYM